MLRAGRRGQAHHHRNKRCPFLKEKRSELCPELLATAVGSDPVEHQPPRTALPRAQRAWDVEPPHGRRDGCGSEVHALCVLRTAAS